MPDHNRITQLNNCQNCGAKLERGNNDTLQCSYCGSSFKEESPKPSTSSQSDLGVDNQNGNNISGEDTTQENGCIIFLILMFLILIVTIVAYKHGHPDTESLASELDTAKTDTSLSNLINSLDAQDEAKKKHFKKTNPDPQVLIRRSKVHSTQLATIISITVKNKTNPEDFMTFVGFSFRLFDKKGNELNTGDTIREGGVSLSKGKSETIEWYLKKRIPQAKTIKVKLKKVEFGDDVWDY